MAYTTHGPSASESGPVLAVNRLTFDPLALLRILLESKARGTSVLPTYLPNKIAADALLDVYAKDAFRITYEAPSYETTEMINQATRELLRQKVRNATGIAIPGTQPPESLPEMTPISIIGDSLVETASDLPQYVVETAAYAILPQALSERVLQPTPVAAERVAPLRKGNAPTKSVAGATAKFLTSVNTLLRTHYYDRLPDLLTTEMRVVEFGVRHNQRNPQLYPRVSLLCTANLSMVLDVYINNERLNVFHYAGRGSNMVTAPMSVRSPTFRGLITLAEYNQYVTGLSLALLALRDKIKEARRMAMTTKVLPEIRRPL
jgi:hypothetical protein